MDTKDKMYIANSILGEVKPLYLRQRILSKLEEFIDKKVPENSVVVSREQFEELMSSRLRLHDLVVYQATRSAKKKVLKELYQLFTAKSLLGDKNFHKYYNSAKAVERLAKQHGIEVKDND